jgi:hypothetical protein
MSPLWILPVLVVAVGVAVVALVARRLSAESQAAAAAVHDLRVLGEEASALADEADQVRRKATAVADPRRRAAPAAQGDQ